MTVRLFLLGLAALSVSTGAGAQTRLSAPSVANRTNVAATLPAPVTLRRPGAQDGRQILREESRASQGALRAIQPRLAACENCIASVNGRSIERATFTPGTADLASTYVITGDGFGDTPGGVYLGGPFNSRPELRVDSWTNNRIVAYFPRGLRGEPDRQGVSLTVRLSDGRLIQTPATARFYAAREEQTVGFDDIPRASLRWQSDTSLTLQVQNGGLHFTAMGAGDSVKRGFTDRVVVNFLNPAFEATAFNVGFCRSDTGNGSANGSDGGRYLYGRYDARWDGDDIVIDRAMWQDHASPFMLVSGSDVFDSCFRDLKITVIGPAGLRPLR